MSPLEALDDAALECRGFRYMPDTPDDYWKTPQEFERAGEGDCEDWAAWTIHRAWEIARPAQPVYRLVVGLVSGEGHAWIEAEQDGQRYWCDPTWGIAAFPVGEWTDRQPLYAYTFDGIIFSERRQYA